MRPSVENPDKNYRILATDIDNTILRRAMDGSYDQSELKNVRKEVKAKYFSQNKGKYEISQELKKSVIFKKHDLILDDYEKNFDVMVCRNVIVYFNNETKEDIYRKFSSSLKKGGLLFVGPTESMFKYKLIGFEKASAFIYRKL
ncbi:MAG: CheR family methyltransferase [Clostridiaceae bacterium]